MIPRYVFGLFLGRGVRNNRGALPDRGHYTWGGLDRTIMFHRHPKEQGNDDKADNLFFFASEDEDFAADCTAGRLFHSARGRT